MNQKEKELMDAAGEDECADLESTKVVMLTRYLYETDMPPVIILARLS